jgi:hypothetical protein
MKNHQIRSCGSRSARVVLQIKLLELGPLGPLDSRHETLGATFKLYHQVSKKPLKSPHYIYIYK